MTVKGEELRNHIIETDYMVDPEGIHHEFAGGMHGRKINFDAMPDDSELFAEWVDATAQYLRFLYGATHAGKLALVSVANGTNRLVGPVGELLGGQTATLLTVKDSSNSVVLTPEAEEAIKSQQPHTAVVLEDVGTTGMTASTAVLAVRQMNVEYVDALFTWQRLKSLERMKTVSVDYHSIIYDHQTYPTFTEEECRAIGHCAAGWELIEHRRPPAATTRY